MLLSGNKRPNKKNFILIRIHLPKLIIMINGPHDFITPVELLIVYFSPAQFETFEMVATWAEHKKFNGIYM